MGVSGLCVPSTLQASVRKKETETVDNRHKQISETMKESIAIKKQGKRENEIKVSNTRNMPLP